MSSNMKMMRSKRTVKLPDSILGFTNRSLCVEEQLYNLFILSNDIFDQWVETEITVN